MKKQPGLLTMLFGAVITCLLTMGAFGGLTYLIIG